MKIKTTIAKENIINNAQKNQKDMRKLYLQTITSSDFLSTFNMKNKNTGTTKTEQVLTKLGSDIKQKKIETKSNQHFLQ